MKAILFSTVITATLVIACKKDTTPPTAPVVTTASLTNVTSSSATAGGTITGNGGAAIAASGIVWSKTNATPTITDSVKTNTVTSGSFTVNLSGLDFNTTYYIRAYATNSVGTAYGNVVTLNTINDTSKVRFTYMGQNLTYGVITSAVTGKKWMDRNLGASAVATSTTDTAGYGHLFQWGRLADGHQVRTSDTTSITSSTDNPGHAKFIVPLTNTTTRDWRNPQNDNLWQGSTGVNNPCPAGWHVPTQTEWEAEGLSDPATALSKLKLPLAGSRSRLSGNLSGVGTSGSYWSSTVTTSPTGNAWAFSLTSGLSSGNQRGLGASVRCIKD